jgi:benzoyl-CoA reductase/2-hydroxyglutaryl-CoA dehydratase subunit BcrC/BadD/HgdB
MLFICCVYSRVLAFVSTLRQPVHKSLADTYASVSTDTVFNCMSHMIRCVSHMATSLLVLPPSETQPF